MGEGRAIGERREGEIVGRVRHRGMAGEKAVLITHRLMARIGPESSNRRRRRRAAARLLHWPVLREAARRRLIEEIEAPSASRRNEEGMALL